MEWVETTGSSVEAAKSQALEQLGVDEADAEFDVVAEPKAGLFGFRKVEARVRARVKPSVPRSKETGRRKSRRNDRGRPSERSAQRASTPREESAEDASFGSDSHAGHGDGVDRRSSDDRRKPRNRRQRPNKPGGDARNSGAKQGDNELETVALEDQVKTLEEFLNGLFAEMNTPASVKSEIDSEEELIKVSIEGDNLGHLIGLRGNALHALQEVTRTVVQRQTGARNGKIILDVAKYREKRKAALERFTKDLAREVVEKQVERNLEPMHPADRKIVHDTINEIEGVETSSAGEEPRRYVVIRPVRSA